MFGKSDKPEIKQSKPKVYKEKVSCSAHSKYEDECSQCERFNSKVK